jgi:hypothetical protein
MSEIQNTNTDFKKGDYVKYDNGQVQEFFTVYKVGEYHLYSTPYNIPSYNKKYCKKI